MIKELEFDKAQSYILTELGEKHQYTDLLKKADTLETEAFAELIAVIADLIVKEFECEEKLAAHTAKKIAETNYGLGAISDLYRDPEISEIWVNAWDDIWVERYGIRSKRYGLAFQGAGDVKRVIDLLCRFDKKEISATKPIVETKLFDGSRITAIIPPVVESPMFNLRCANTFTPTLGSMLGVGTLDEGLIDLLEILVKGRANIVVIGETGAGKTQLIRFLLGFVKENLHIVTMETREELFLKKLYDYISVVSMEECLDYGIGHTELFRVSLRMTPDIIVCGEMRTYEAEWVINAMRRGHPGSMSCLHSTECDFVIDDIAEMISDDGKTRDAIQLKERISNAVDIIVQINKSDADGSRKVTRVTEVVKDSSIKFKDSNYGLNDLYIYSHNDKSFIQTGQIRTKEIQQKLSQYIKTFNDVDLEKRLEKHLYLF